MSYKLTKIELGISTFDDELEPVQSVYLEYSDGGTLIVKLKDFARKQFLGK